MTGVAIRVVLAGALVCSTAAAAMAQPAGKTQTLTGTVVQVEGNTLAVKMSSGEVRMFTPPPERRFLVDGRELRLSELQPGTKLTATVAESATTVMERTVATLEGKVWYASGPTVILSLPSGENRMYTIKSGDPVKFYDSNGKEMTVFDLRKGMNIKATKVTEAPRTEFVATTTVTGTGPARAAAGTAPGAAPAGASAGAPPVASAPRQQAAPSQAGTPAAAGTPKTLPKTASPLPLVGLVGLASLVMGLGLTARRRWLAR